MTSITDPTAVNHAIAASTPACPSWCGDHYRSSEFEVFHQHDTNLVWGASRERYGEPKLGLGLARNDDVGGPGEPMLDVMFSKDGVANDDTVSIPLDTAQDFVDTIQHLIDEARAA